MKYSKDSQNAFIVIRAEGLEKNTKVKDFLIQYRNIFRMTMKKSAPAKIVTKFNNQILRPEELVSNVLKCGYVDQKEVPFKINYLVVTESVDEKLKENDKRSVEEVLKDIEGPIQTKTKKKKHKSNKHKVSKDQKKEEKQEPNLSLQIDKRAKELNPELFCSKTSG